MLGGTVFLSRAVAEDALRRGNDVVCAARGVSGDAPDGAEVVLWDRTRPAPQALREREFDAVVDVGRHPSWVRSAAEAFSDAHWVYVSTINVYADQRTPGGRPGTLALREPVTGDVDLAVDPEAYGPMKVACEHAVREVTSSPTIVRPGLIVGPGDRSGRFAYWPRRLAEGGEVLAPGSPLDSVQVVDVRDLAHWLVDCAASGRLGTYDGVGPSMGMGEFLDAVAEGVDSFASLTWVPQEFLQERGVEPWMGPASIPLWLPRPEYDGMLAHDATPSLEAGLSARTVAETARDTLGWLEATPDAPVTGISREREAELLEAWKKRA